MSNFLIKPTSIKKSDILNKVFSLHPSEHKKIDIKNMNLKSISELVYEEGVGEQIDVEEYLKFNSNYTLVTISNMSKCIIDETKGEKVSPFIYNTSSKKLFTGDVLVSRNASLGKITLVNKDFNGILNGGISYLRFKEDYKYYAFAFFLINYGVDYLTSITSGGGTQKNAKRQNLLDLKIPFTSIKNHSNPDLIQKYISLITQNIIDKEEQIKIKDKKIKDLIEKELKENQKENTLSYGFPKISEIKKEKRLDTGLYAKNFKVINNLIINYKKGYVNFEKSGFRRKKGPNLAISVIGQSYYSNTKHNDNFKQLILSKNVTDEGGLDSIQYIGSQVNLPTLNKFDFLLFARGDIGRVILIDDFLIGATSNFDVFFISSDKESFENIFTLCYLKYLREVGFWKFYGVGGSGASSLTDYYFKKVNIPNFEESKKKEISKIYYNHQGHQTIIENKDYLLLEKDRNKEIGIFQLNMEIFSLKERLNELIRKIIADEPITI